MATFVAPAPKGLVKDTNNTVLPPEFDLHKYIDYDEQFDKSFLEPLRFIVNAINWNFEKTSTLDNFF